MTNNQNSDDRSEVQSAFPSSSAPGMNMRTYIAIQLACASISKEGIGDIRTGLFEQALVDAKAFVKILSKD